MGIYFFFCQHVSRSHGEKATRARATAACFRFQYPVHIILSPENRRKTWGGKKRRRNEGTEFKSSPTGLAANTRDEENLEKLTYLEIN